MRTETVSDKQGICIILLFLLGSNLVLGIARAAKRDAWLAVIIGMAEAQVILLMYSRILSLYPQNNIFDIQGAL